MLIYGHYVKTSKLSRNVDTVKYGSGSISQQKSAHVNSLAPGRCGGNLKVSFSNWLHTTADWAPTVKLLSYEY